MTKSEFLTSARWKHKRAAILRRDGYRCQHCARYGRASPAEIVHHIKPYEQHPELGLDSRNLVSLCRKCHNREHPEKGAAAARARHPPTLRDFD